MKYRIGFLGKIRHSAHRINHIFDPNLHEAMTSEASEDHGENEIMEEYRKGYTMADRLLRPSQVKVAVTPGD